MKKILIILFCFSFAVICALPEELKTTAFFSEKDIQRVRSGEIITRMYLQNDAVKENTDLKIDVPKSRYAAEDLSAYEMITDEKAFIPYSIKDGSDRLRFYNTLTAFSKLKGMTYFSRRIMKVQEMILDCYRIDSPTAKKRTEDMIYSEIKDKIVNYFLQKDNRFGKLVFMSELYNEGDNFIMINTCTQPITSAVFNICDKNEYKIITYFIYDKETKGFYYYTVNAMRVRLKFVLSENKLMVLYPTTFSNRLRAATVHFAGLLGLDWKEKLNPWNEKLLKKGKYRNY
jgi:hypothetical protein